eukprot:15442156-Alexandrium_andersonii.AAC.1
MEAQGPRRLDGGEAWAAVHTLVPKVFHGHKALIGKRGCGATEPRLEASHCNSGLASWVGLQAWGPLFVVRRQGPSPRSREPPWCPRDRQAAYLSLIHISEPTRLALI